MVFILQLVVLIQGRTQGAFGMGRKITREVLEGYFGLQDERPT